ncbi:hypothetical protein ACFQBY_17710 [Promicromonospora citrea]|uniref:DUF308 domain-containing protein n=1 Tax=Promicromonospora citrea TaxID=43677 RepID=A0A8H9GLR0_9MICO|nr:hypothetical protein [Promicromonospora citrea]NNH52153.1 hypothetical protein [Promicromonospora citrea]GGM37452.1 hypothetical protein GCM10010102_36240 [Promicromonospora citrea]
MAASNTDDRDDDVPGDAPRELGDDDVASRWADIVATLGDIGGSAGDSAAGPDRTAASSQTSGRDGDSSASPGSDADTAADPDDSASDRPGGRRVGGWSDGGWSGGDWTAAPADAGDDTAAEVRRPTGPRDWPLTPEAEALEEAESHFTPPEPPPLLSRDPLLTMAWSFVVGVPVLAVIGMILSAAVPALDIPPLLGQIGLGLFVAGLGVLIWRMPHQRDPDDDGPGAVV